VTCGPSYPDVVAAIIVGGDTIVVIDSIVGDAYIEGHG
jgi:hypothetical protein